MSLQQLVKEGLEKNVRKTMKNEFEITTNKINVESNARTLKFSIQLMWS